MELLCFTLVLGCISSLDAFTPLKSSTFSHRARTYDSSAVRQSTTGIKLQMAIASSAALLVKKGKFKEVQTLQANMTATGESHPVNQYLRDGTRPFGVGKPVDFYNSTASRFQSISVVPEFSKKAKTGFVLELPPPEILGGVLRDAGSRGDHQTITILVNASVFQYSRNQDQILSTLVCIHAFQFYFHLSFSSVYDNPILMLDFHHCVSSFRHCCRTGQTKWWCNS